jgi:NitT/TauT family transport system permease protein
MSTERYKVKWNLPGTAVILAMIPAWWLLSAATGGTVVPSPLSVGRRLLEIAPLLMGVHAAASLARVVAGLAAALLTAVPLGLAMGRSRALDRTLAPAAYLLYPVPKIALLPAVMVLFGLADTSKVTVVFLVLFFQVLLAVRDAARDIPAQYYLSLRSLGARKRHAALLVTWPAVLPQLLTALRVGTGTALAVLFFAETFGTRRGLGYFVVESWMRTAYPDMYAGIVALGLAGLAIFLLIDALQRRACRWLRPAGGGSAGPR